MRLLSIGYPLPNVDIDNYNVLTAPSYFDYDALLVDPESITRVVRSLVEEGANFEAFDRRPVINGPGSAASVSAADLIRRRADETQRLLESGGVVLVVGRPNAVQAGLSGFEGCDRYSWLPAPAGVSWNPPFLRAAEGQRLRVTWEDHALSGPLRNFREQLRYRAVFDDRQPGFREHARTLATGGAGVPIAVQFRLLGGTVVFLPAFPDDNNWVRSDAAQALVDAARQMLSDAPAEEPYFARSLAVPGLDAVEKELAEAEAAIAEANERAQAARDRRRELAAHRELIWQYGAGFANAVQRALSMLGFVPMQTPGDPLEIQRDGVLAYVEVESSRAEVVEWPYVRLQRRLEERLLKRSDQLKGVVVVNGYRESQLEYRQQQYTDALRIACENYRYCLITADTLFDMSVAVIEGAGEDTLDAMRRRILRTNGLLDRARALGQAPDEAEAGTIF